MRNRAIGLAVVVALSISLAAPSAHAYVGADRDEGSSITATGEDGTGANSAPREPQAPSVCDPHHTWYKVTSSTKGVKITTWSKHLKNDSTRESFTWSTTRTTRFTATVDTRLDISGEVSLRKVAKVTLGSGVSYGAKGEVASTRSYSRSMTFTRPGKWIIYKGVHSGKGKVARYKCASNGQSYSRIGYADATTFEKAPFTGLLNCAKRADGPEERAAKAKCG